jgi:hypothetical protein
VDDDLEQMTRDQLIAEVRKLRAGIRDHRDSTKPALLASPGFVGVAAREDRPAAHCPGLA